MKPTRREWIVFGLFASFYIITTVVKQSTLDRFEWLLIPAVVALAWYINTDPQRKVE